MGPSNGNIALPFPNPMCWVHPQDAIVTTRDDIAFTIVAIVNLKTHFVIWILGVGEDLAHVLQ